MNFRCLAATKPNKISFNSPQKKKTKTNQIETKKKRKKTLKLKRLKFIKLMMNFRTQILLKRMQITDTENQ